MQTELEVFHTIETEKVIETLTAILAFNSDILNKHLSYRDTLTNTEFNKRLTEYLRLVLFQKFKVNSYNLSHYTFDYLIDEYKKILSSVSYF